MFKVLHQRLRERFFRPVKELRRYDSTTNSPMRPGFAILALDCLLIETLSSYRAGKSLKTGKSGRAFKAFLREGYGFREFFAKGEMAADFYDDVRNGLLHDGETRKNWKVQKNTKLLLDCETRSRIINRTLFHKAILCEYRQYFKDLRLGKNRASFRSRLAVLCQSGDPGGGD
jgi:hypothetical protein